jgi:hypothetical protein
MGRLKTMKVASAGFLGLALAGLSPQDVAGEYEVKAAYLYNFTIHVEWPEDSFARKDSPLCLFVLGKDPCGKILEKALQDKSAQGRPLEVSREKTVEELQGCHILFLPDSEKQNLPKVLEALKGKSVLIVGESAGLARQGAVFNFFLEDRKVRLEVNVEAAARNRLKIGSKLLKIARNVSVTDK